MTDTGYTKRAARVLTLTEQAAGGAVSRPPNTF